MLKKFLNVTPYLCGGLHLLAIFVLLFWLKDGTEANPELLQRVRYISTNALYWQAGWIVWMASSLSLIAMYLWWTTKIPNKKLAYSGLILAMIGSVCDLSGETIYSTTLVDHAHQLMAETEMHPSHVKSFMISQWMGTALTAIFANGFYTLGGILLTVGTAEIKGWIRILTWSIWTAGIGISLFASLGFNFGIMICSATLFPTLVIWCFWLPQIFEEQSS